MRDLRILACVSRKSGFSSENDREKYNRKSKSKSKSKGKSGSRFPCLCAFELLHQVFPLTG